MNELCGNPENYARFSAYMSLLYYLLSITLIDCLYFFVRPIFLISFSYIDYENKYVVASYFLVCYHVVWSFTKAVKKMICLQYLLHIQLISNNMSSVLETSSILNWLSHSTHMTTCQKKKDKDKCTSTHMTSQNVNAQSVCTQNYFLLISFGLNNIQKI